MSRFHIPLHLGLWLLAGGICLTPAIPVAFAATAPRATRFETRLLPSPVSDLTAVTVTGEGRVSALLDGNKLVVTGTFGGLGGTATEAHLFMGAGIGIPGSAIDALTVSQDVTGTVSGTLTLNGQQLAALNRGCLYIQIDSQKTVAPYGNLWGWLLPEHEAVSQDVPEQGHWFMPQYDVPQGK